MLAVVTPDAKESALSEAGAQANAHGWPPVVQDVKLGVQAATPVHDGPGLLGPNRLPVAVAVVQGICATFPPVAVILKAAPGAVMLKGVPPGEPLVVQLVAEAGEDEASVETTIAPRTAVRKIDLNMRFSFRGRCPHGFESRRRHPDATVCGAHHPTPLTEIT
jgi:hypothetical protein